MKLETARKERRPIMCPGSMSGSIGKIEPGIVSVNAYGVYEQITILGSAKEVMKHCSDAQNTREHRYDFLTI